MANLGRAGRLDPALPFFITRGTEINDRTWNYAQITAATKERLAVFAGQSRKAQSEEDGLRVAWHHAHQAEGAFEVWAAIVGGARQDDDTRQLRALMVAARPNGD